MPPRRRHRNRGGLAAGPGRAFPSVRDTAEAHAAPPRLLVDGRNVQRALERGAAPGSLPTASLVAQLRAAFAGTHIELVFDGHPGGSPTGSVAPGFSVTYSRHATADAVIGERVREALRELGPAGAWSVTVVSDDREVRDHARRNGARVEGTAWLADRMAALARGGTGIGHGRAPSTAKPAPPAATATSRDARAARHGRRRAPSESD